MEHTRIPYTLFGETNYIPAELWRDDASELSGKETNIWNNHTMYGEYRTQNAYELREYELRLELLADRETLAKCVSRAQN